MESNPVLFNNWAESLESNYRGLIGLARDHSNYTMLEK